MTKGREGKSGVFNAEDFRDNLIIDRYDPVFASMRASKRRHLHSVNSEDAVTWNVFRSLRQIAPTIWLPDLFATAFPGGMLSHAEHATVELWKTVEPPPTQLPDADEGESEIDVIIETPSLVWFIEAKLHGDMGARTTARADRDQVLRNIDVGSYYAGVRRFYFSLLVADRRRSEPGVQAVESYRDVSKVRDALGKHRPDGLVNLGGVGLLQWSDLGEVLAGTIESTKREDEQQYAARALTWLRAHGLASHSTV